MRLRLRIERNGLPPVSILWPVKDPDQRLTISQLLHLVDEKVPLEGDTWGLEDYAVSIGGYEALHYNELGSVCKDEDEVIVRPLQYRERKFRLLAGRDQISADGRHLMDGVPFGRPLITRVVRPEVTIPPLKKQKLNPKTGGVSSNLLVPWAEVSEDDESSEDQDGSYDEEDITEDSDMNGGASENESLAQKPDMDTDTSDDEDGEEVDDNDGSSSTDTDGSGSDSLDSGSVSDSESASSTSESGSNSQGSSVNIELRKTKHTAPRCSSRQLQTKLIETPANLTSGYDDSTQSHKVTLPAGVPFKGKDTTQNRNQRRRDSKKLKFLKDNSLLPADASFDDLRRWEREEEAKGAHVTQQNAMEKEIVTAGRRKLLHEMVTNGGIDVTPGSQSSIVRQRTVVDDEEDGPPEELSSRAPTIQSSSSMDQLIESTGLGLQNGKLPTPSLTSRHEAPNHMRTAQASVASRLIFGSLGVKAPRNPDEANAVRAKLLKRSLHGTNATSTVSDLANTDAQSSLVEDEDDSSDPWQQKLIISAVECCDEGVTLSAPPFPFRQRWDVQYQGKRKQRDSTDYNAPNKRRKKGKEYIATGHYMESYDKYNDVDGDALNYDDAEEPYEGYGSYWEDGALLEGQSVEENVSAADQQLLAETAATGEDDSFPPLPVDISTLPLLRATEAMKGDVVVYHGLSCSAATNWQPSTTTHTVRLDEESDGGWMVTVAPRDLPPKNYNDDGQRVYIKFEMGGFSDDEDEAEDGPEFLKWEDMLDPRLLLRPASID